MIAELHFEQQGRSVSARLEEDLSWSCEEPSLQDYLNDVCPIDPSSPVVGGLIVHQLYQVAERLGAEIAFGQGTRLQTEACCA